MSAGMTFIPSRRYQSGGLTPTACTRTSTSPGPIFGIGTSSYRRTSGPPAAWNWIAFIAPVALSVNLAPTVNARQGTAVQGPSGNPSFRNGMTPILDG
ncbi:hypothetical protein GCM10018772_15470 [Streptomyces fumanus]|uniref:Uncharacterized protein n=1 Tax=Streptomyces fumanus TaxID=67302 RepID=A0A919A8R2_9ACTN|nr:hypothetical protein GCM10018772_15470 [Streptomyces fumanus]